MGVIRLASLLGPGKRGLAAARARKPDPAALRRRRPADAESSGAPRRALARDAGHGMMEAPGSDDNAVPDAVAPDELGLDKKKPSEEVMSEASNEERVQTVLQFYEEKIELLTKAQGDRDHLPISGNIYMYRAIAKFGQCKDVDTNSLFQRRAGPFVWSGIILTMVIQIIAPFALLIWAITNVTKIDDNLIGVQAWRTDLDSTEIGITYLLSRLLSVLFLLLFTINGTYALKSDMLETEKMICLCRVFNKVAEKKPYNEETGEGYKTCNELWLWAGAVINSLLVIVLSLCMLCLFIIAGGDNGPKDVIFDAFGITFLYNLDDPDGDLSFLDELWDEDIIGDIYGTLADQDKIMDDIKAQRASAFTANNVYQVALYIMKAMIPLLPGFFIFLELKFTDAEF